MGSAPNSEQLSAILRRNRSEWDQSGWMRSKRRRMPRAGAADDVAARPQAAPSTTTPSFAAIMHGPCVRASSPCAPPPALHCDCSALSDGVCCLEAEPCPPVPAACSSFFLPGLGGPSNQRALHIPQTTVDTAGQDAPEESFCPAPDVPAHAGGVDSAAAGSALQAGAWRWAWEDGELGPDGTEGDSAGLALVLEWSMGAERLLPDPI